MARNVGCELVCVVSGETTRERDGELNEDEFACCHLFKSCVLGRQFPLKVEKRAFVRRTRSRFAPQDGLKGTPYITSVSFFCIYHLLALFFTGAWHSARGSAPQVTLSVLQSRGSTFYRSRLQNKLKSLS
jgi:hypothetical protein